MKCCCDCRYYDRNDGRPVCRRYPPRYAGDHSEAIGRFPRVSAFTSSCGEFRRKIRVEEVKLFISSLSGCFALAFFVFFLLTVIGGAANSDFLLVACALAVCAMTWRDGR